MTSRRPSCLIYCSATHLFVSGGLYYAVDLSSRYEVHVLLHRQQEGGLGDVERAALARRGIVLHWLESVRGIAKHRYFAREASSLVGGVAPRYILTLDDIGIFACYLGREAERADIPLVCFQSGAFLAASGEEQRKLELNYGYALAIDRLRRRGWPAAAAYLFARLDLRARHALDYWLGPVAAGCRPYIGESSLYLRSGIECQRYGRLFLVNQPGARAFRIADGMPADKIVPVVHPLVSEAGRTAYAEMYGKAEPAGDILVLVAYSMSPGPGHAEAAAANVTRLLRHLSDRYPGRRILVKLHPTMASDRGGALAASLDPLADSLGNVVVVPPSRNAIGLLGRASVLISTPSTALGLMRLFDSRIIACVSFDTPLSAHPLPYPDGVHLFPTVEQLEKVDLLALGPAPSGSEIPPDAVRCGVDEVIDRHLSRDEHGTRARNRITRRRDRVGG